MLKHPKAAIVVVNSYGHIPVEQIILFMSNVLERLSLMIVILKEVIYLYVAYIFHWLPQAIR